MLLGLICGEGGSSFDKLRINFSSLIIKKIITCGPDFYAGGGNGMNLGQLIGLKFKITTLVLTSLEFDLDLVSMICYRDDILSKVEIFLELPFDSFVQPQIY